MVIRPKSLGSRRPDSEEGDGEDTASLVLSAARDSVPLRKRGRQEGADVPRRTSLRKRAAVEEEDDEVVAESPPRKHVREPTPHFTRFTPSENPPVREAKSRLRIPTQSVRQASRRIRIIDSQGESQSLSPGLTVQSGQEHPNPNANLLSQKAIQKSHEAIRQLISKAFSQLKQEVIDVEKSLEKKMEKCEDATNLAIRVMAGLSKSRDTPQFRAAQLAPLPQVYSGKFHSRIFRIQFIRTVVEAVTECGTNEEEPDMKDVVLAVESVMHGLIFRRLLLEKSTEALSKSEAHSIACRFRRKLCLSLITTAQNNPTIGVDRVVIGDEASGIPRPKWLPKDFVRKSLINDVLSKEDVSTSKSRGVPVSRGLEEATGAMSEEAVERQTLGEEIVKMMNQLNVQHMNKSREL